LGGRIRSVELKDYKRADKTTPVILFDGDSNQFALSFFTSENKSISTSSIYFTPSNTLELASAGHPAIIKMIADIGGGRKLEQIYSLTEEGFNVKYDVQFSGLGKLIAANNNYINLDWKTAIPLQEHHIEAEQKASTIYYRTGEETDYISERKEEEIELPASSKWISFKQQYFNSTLIADKEFDAKAKITTTNDPSGKYVKKMAASLTFPYNHGESETFGMRFFFGPNQYKILAKEDLLLENMVPLGWGIFRWVNRGMVIPIFNLLNGWEIPIGLLILLMTIIIKTLLTPLVYRSFLSSAKMRILKPEMDALKARLGNDMSKLQQENMKLYKQAGVNPLGGCVPVLLQMPILIAMFQFFPSAFELRQQAFLWSSDLSTYDSIWTFGKLPIINSIYGDHVSLFTLLFVISTLVYTWYNNQVAAGLNDQMKIVSYIMPIIFLGVFNSYAAGLSYYYFLSNLATIGQQFLIRRRVDENKLRIQIQEHKKKPESERKTAFQKRLEDYAKKRGIDPNNTKRK
jgi:YidC/Oxa1 family membrane protein insertase